ncbi:MAG: hypothetical protein Kow002_01830 [Anaerolineales bacterium]
MTAEDPSRAYMPPIPEPLSPNDEKTWAMVSHLSVLANLISGFLGPVIPLIVYLVYKDRSRYVAYHSLQSLIFQLVWWVGGGILAGTMWALSGVLSAVLIGLLCVPLACLFSLLPIGALIYGIIGGVQTSQGQDFKYWLIGDWVRGTLTN